MAAGSWRPATEPDWGAFFWLLQHHFPGEPGFTRERFAQQPVPFILQAVEEAIRQERLRLHREELPIAVLTTFTANLNRDPKKRPLPFSLSDFTCWADVAETSQPPAAAGAAMLELVRRDQFPSYGLTFFSELKAVGKDAKLPPRLILASEDALLLAPYRVDAARWGGFLIARAEASGLVRDFYSEDGNLVQLRVPADVRDRGSVVAEEGAVLPIAGFPET